MNSLPLARGRDSMWRARRGANVRVTNAHNGAPWPTSERQLHLLEPSLRPLFSFSRSSCQRLAAYLQFRSREESPDDAGIEALALFLAPTRLRFLEIKI